MKSATTDSTTQQFLDIYNITNDIIIMKDGSVSMLLTVDAMNFGLLAEEEQDAVMYAYAGLLNSLNYPIQVVVSSHTKDVTKYLDLLKSQEEQTNNELMRKRIKTYRQFVSNLIRERNVLDKKFYVAIPASGLELGFVSAKSFVPGQKGGFDISAIETNVIVEKAHNILEPRRDHLIAQFARIGLFAKQLTTQEIIQLFYISYNPEAAEGQVIADSNNYTSPLVTASIEKDFMLNATPASQGTNISTNANPQPNVSAQSVSPVIQTSEPAVATTNLETPSSAASTPVAGSFSQPASSAATTSSVTDDAGLDLPHQALPPTPQLPTTQSDQLGTSDVAQTQSQEPARAEVVSPPPISPPSVNPDPVTQAGIQAEINQVVNQFDSQPNPMVVPTTAQTAAPTPPTQPSNSSSEISVPPSSTTEPMSSSSPSAPGDKVIDYPPTNSTSAISPTKMAPESPQTGMGQGTPPPIPEL